MRKLVYYIASTLDGYIADLNGSTDVFDQPPEYLAQLARRFPETFPAHARTPLGINSPNLRFGTVLMGRHTYEPALHAGIPSPYPHLNQYVFSRHLSADPQSGVHIVSGDPLTVVRELKNQPGPHDLWLCGGGNLASQLVPELDELIVKLNPVTLGRGIPLFGNTSRLSLTLVDSQPLSGGVLLLHYGRR